MADCEQICFCFGYTREDIEADYTLHGKSTVLAHIIAEKKAGGCQCKTKNPTGK